MLSVRECTADTATIRRTNVLSSPASSSCFNTRVKILSEHIRMCADSGSVVSVSARGTHCSLLRTDAPYLYCSLGVELIKHSLVDPDRI